VSSLGARAWLTRERGSGGIVKRDGTCAEYFRRPVDTTFIAIRCAPALKFSHFTP